MSQPQRPAGATCVSCVSSAKWNCHQTTPEVLENLVLFREQTVFQSEQQHGSHDTPSQSLGVILFQEIIMGYLTKY